MWKPITIKPGDQTLVGKTIRQCRLEPLTCLFVGKEHLITITQDGREQGWSISAKYNSFEINEPDPPKKLVAPVLYRPKGNDLKGPEWMISRDLFSSLEEAKALLDYDDVKNDYIFPALPNSEGFYEVEE